MALTNLSKRTRFFLFLVIALLLLLLAAVLAVSLGPVDIPFPNVLAPSTPQERAIVWFIRLPRITMALLVGGGLAVSGATIQAVFRNPIAEPGILGISLGAALGAVIAIASGLATMFVLAIPFAAFIGATITIALVYAIAGLARGNSLYSLLLAGIAVSSFVSAVISLILIAVADIFAQRQILFWLAGGLDTIGWDDVRIAVLPISVGIVVMLYLMRDLNLLMVGDSEATTLGANVVRTRTLAILAAALATGTAVAFTGTIGFVGLIIPHAVRLLVGQDNRAVLLLSIIGGAIFLLLADTLARTLLMPVEIRVGIITALVGTPVFVFLLLRSRLI